MNRLPLETVADIKRGRRIRNEQLADRGVRFLNAKALAEPDAQPQYVPPGDAPPMDLQAGDVAVAVAFRPGAARAIKPDLADAVLGSDCVALRARPNGPVTPGWLALWVRSSDFRQQIDSRTSRAGLPRVSAKDIPALQVPWIPEDEQRHAVERLERINHAASELEALLAQVQQLRRAETDLAILGLDVSDRDTTRQPTRNTAAGRRRPS